MFAAFLPGQEVGPGAGGGRWRLGMWPALLTAALVLVAGLTAVVQNETDIEAAYADEAARAFNAKDYTRARLCFARLTRSPRARLAAFFGLAETYEALGAPGEAAPLWARLAPDDRAVYAPAHVRRATALLSTPGGPSSARASAAERQLRLALAADPRSVVANALLGRLLAATGRPGQAVAPLITAADSRPELRLELARARRAEGLETEARHQAKQALQRAADAVDVAPDDAGARLRYAEAAAFLGDHAGAVATLRAGLAQTRDPRVRSRLASLYAEWADTPGEADAPGRALMLLGEGLRVDPRNPLLLERFAAALRAGGTGADEARQALREALADGRAGAGVHFTLGMDAWLHDDPRAARAHLEQAARLDPGGPAIANNLAWVLAHEPAPDLKRALALAELALDRLPGTPQFRGTRGTILVKLERWGDAVPDLEAALAADAGGANVHRDLAEAYTRLGLPKMAEAHRRLTPAPAPGG